ncbi:MAG: hypothetical protein R2744_03120 [Bacteroidales bacterium]
MLKDLDPSVYLFDMLSRWGLEQGTAMFLRTLIIVVGVAVLSWLANTIAKFIIDRVVAVIVRKTKFKWDDIFLESHVFTRLSHFAPALVIWAMAGWALDAYPKWLDFCAGDDIPLHDHCCYHST